MKLVLAILAIWLGGVALLYAAVVVLVFGTWQGAIALAAAYGAARWTGYEQARRAATHTTVGLRDGASKLLALLVFSGCIVAAMRFTAYVVDGVLLQNLIGIPLLVLLVLLIVFAVYDLLRGYPPANPLLDPEEGEVLPLVPRGGSSGDGAEAEIERMAA